MEDVITTKSRKLEQFFFAHGIDYIACTKDEEAMTVWSYPRNEETIRILEEFKLGIARRSGKKGA